MQVHSFHLFPWPDINHIEQAEWPFSKVAYDSERAKELYENYFEQIEFSDEVGFDGVVLNEHHFSAYAMDPSPIVIASHLAARTNNLDLAFLGNVMPVRGNPIRVAEELAVLDTITEGRVIGGMARGISMEYLAYNVEQGPMGEGEDRSRDMFREAVALVEKAWTAEEPFDWDGEYWQYENVYIWPKPYQDPRPDMWMPAVSDASIRIAAKHRMGVGRRGTPEIAKEGYDTYTRIAEEEFDWSPSTDKFILLKGIFMGQSREEAKESIKEHMEFQRNYLFGGVHRGATAKIAGDDHYQPEKHRQDLAPHAKDQMDFDFDAAVESGEILVGEPEHVVAEMERQYEESGGIGHLIGTFQHGNAPHEKTMRSLELFADEVLPEFQKLG